MIKPFLLTIQQFFEKFLSILLAMRVHWQCAYLDLRQKICIIYLNKGGMKIPKILCPSIMNLPIDRFYEDKIIEIDESGIDVFHIDLNGWDLCAKFWHDPSGN